MSEKSESFQNLHLKLKTPVEIFDEKYGSIMQSILNQISYILEQKIDFTKSEIDSCINIDFRWKNPEKDQDTDFILIPKELFEAFLIYPYFLEIFLKIFSQKGWHANHFIYDENKTIVTESISLKFTPEIPS